MKTFIQWAEDRNIKLPGVEVKTEGSTKRAAVRPWAYPELYGRGQYPKEYFRPIAADAVTYDSK